MKIKNHEISNFRGISHLSAPNLGNTVIIAGQNGSGKSCIFDAIRLLKSSYGGYHENEYQQFFGEFGIQLHLGTKELKSLFNDHNQNVVITCGFEFSDREKQYIVENASELLGKMAWRKAFPDAMGMNPVHTSPFSSTNRDRASDVDMKVSQQLPELYDQLQRVNVIGRIEIAPSGQVHIVPSQLLTMVFSNYRPGHIGIIDFHGAQRNFNRENVAGVNLSLDQNSQSNGQNSLYNHSSKYHNIKSEMAALYIRDLLSRAAAGDGQLPNYSLEESLKTLFQTFFPTKEFLGPRANRNGSLSFPVRMPNGSEHDLDELSSGEKEILYGYLRMRTSAAGDSVILLDEPELHLNPRLIRGLPEFYRKHLSENLNNQLWLITHSDALIREAMGKPGFDVFHMSSIGTDEGIESQLRPMRATNDLEIALTDMVGDLAAYRPGGKAIIFEGGGGSDFDKEFCQTLFADELVGMNLISGSNKERVRGLHEVLERAHNNNDFPTKFFSIVDSDFDSEPERTGSVTKFAWNSYHIENYLLMPEVIAAVLKKVNPRSAVTEESVAAKLKEAAKNVIPGLISREVSKNVNDDLVRCINLGFSPQSSTPAQDLRSAMERSLFRIHEKGAEFTASHLQQLQTGVAQKFETMLLSGEWIRLLPGREILKQFVKLQEIPFAYEIFRNLIWAEMVSRGVRPSGMSNIIDKIKAA